MTDRAKILVVDDELGPRESLRMILKDRYDVTTVESGIAAVEYVNLNPVDVVLLDIKMPGLDGIETLKKIKQIHSEVEVVLITAYASVDTAQEAVRYDAVDYLIKPFSRADVDSVVEKGLARRRERLESTYELNTLQEQMRALTLVSSQIGSRQELVSVLSTIGKEATRVLGADAYAIYSLNREEEAPAKPLCGELTEGLTEDAAKAVREIIAGKTVSSPEPVIISLSGDDDSDAAISDAAIRELMLQQGYKLMLLLPLFYTQKLLGALVFCYKEDKSLSQRERELTQAFANQAAVIVQTDRLYEELRSKATALTQKVAQLSIVRNISAAILSNLDLDAVLSSIIAGLEELGYKDVRVLYLADKTQQVTAKEHELPSGAPASDVFPRQTEYKWWKEKQQFKITAPIMVEENPVCLLEVYTQQEPNGKEIELMDMLSEQIAIAIKNSQLYKEINKTKNYLESLIQNAGDAIITANLDDEIVSWNKAAERIFQYSPVEVIGKNIGELLPGFEYKKNKELMLSYQQPKSFETRGQRNDDTPVDLDVTISPVKDGDQNLIGVSAIVQDVTEQNKLRYQLVHSEKQRALGVMSSGVAHNFNNILTGILGHAQLLQMRIPLKEDFQYVHNSLKTIENATLEGAAVIKRMQKFSYTNGNEAFKPVNLNEVVETSLSLSEPKWKHEPEAKGIKVAIHKQLGDIPSVQAEASQLNEVLVNLIFNAVEAMPNGGEISIKTGIEEDNSLYLSVADDGVGMSQEVKEKIFDPFFTTKGVKGVGLGMSVVHGILKSHRAQIDIHTAPGKGTEFIIRFPLSKKIEEQSQVKRATTRKITPASILFIEDEKNIRELFANIAETAGYRVILASSGAEGLEILQKSPKEFDVLFTDLGMPNMNGWQVVKRAKQIAPYLPVILGTGWDAEITHSQREHSEVDFVVSKPYKINELLDAINKAMELKATQAVRSEDEDLGG
jgi:PAS domain S-box-containing protein